ncbi:CpsD/CapB family tyrosine-protein kinase [Alteribacter natronophilus]|uniref:CpsD/CapB family tyrosine-protein kinase n=1 Tax=Alteribacter natronophilus TaxID=2583810 RepID=UPI0014863266|nr:CpsD/CapB family tyrosine-protein kinase [Alteribacter natronophilus]
MNLLKDRRIPQLATNPRSRISEEFDRIRLNIEFASYEISTKTILVTSPGYNEGKSTVIANMALNLAVSGKSVLLIDIDVKDPSVHKIFRVKNTVGLTNVLSGQKNVEDVINQTDNARLKIITTGPVPYDLDALLQSRKMDELLSRSSREYDYVLLDSPPVLEGETAKIVAGRCDGAIMVLRVKRTEDEVALEAKKILEMTNTKLFGIIMNARRRSFFSRKE